MTIATYSYRTAFAPFGRDRCSRVKGRPTFAILSREPRSPGANELQLIENASYITGIAIERHMEESAAARTRSLRLLLEITSSVTSKLYLRLMVEALSTNLFRVLECDVSALLLPDTERATCYVSLSCTIRTLKDPSARDRRCR